MIVGQFVRYAVVGLASNLLLYLLYLVLTWFGMGPKLAMTLGYCVGTLQTFYVNRAWTFGGSGGRWALARYATVTSLAYTIQWLLMWLFVDRLGYPHQLVQLVLIFVIAVFMFLGFRTFVFGNRGGPAKTP